MTPSDSNFPGAQIVSGGVQAEFPPAVLNQHAQRWFYGRDSYRPSQEPIRPQEFAVKPLGRVAAKRFVQTHHYSGSYVCSIGDFGLWHKSGLNPSRLVGVASFATPSNPNSIRRWSGLEDFHNGAELGRFVLLDEVAGNGETWFLTRALRLLKAQRPELRIVLSYSDPVPRRNLDTGTLSHRGHYGSIYQACGSLYLGRAGRKTLILSRTGEALPNRALAKVRNEEVGADYSQALIERLTGVTRLASEDPRSFVDRALRSPMLRRVSHSGNHLYLFPLAGDRREKAAILHLPVIQGHVARAIPFPKIIDQAA